MVRGTQWSLSTYFARLGDLGTIASRCNPIVILMLQWKNRKLREMIQMSFPDAHTASNRNSLTVQAQILTVAVKHLLCRQTSGRVASIVGWGPGLNRASDATKIGLDFTTTKWHKMQWQFHGSGELCNAPEQGMCLEEVNLFMV